MNTEEKFYTCKYDRAFKEVFLNNKNKMLLRALLESILKLEIYDIEIENNERNTGSLNVKRKHLDAILNTNIGKVEIEVNSTMKRYLHPRNMSYLCDVYSHDVLVGDEYNEDVMYIQINLSYGLKDNKLNRIYKMMDKDGKNYVNNFIIYELNMDRYMKFWYNGDKKKIEENKYLVMLDLQLDELENLAKDKVVSKYMETLKKINTEYKFKEYMSAEEDNRKIMNSIKREIREDAIEEAKKEVREEVMKEARKKVRKEIETEAIKQGEKKRNMEIAREMLKENIDINIISKCTGLNVSDVNNMI